MDVIFIHHSVGRRIVAAGLRDRVGRVDPGIAISDHDYNHIGMAGPDGKPDPAKALPIPGDNTDPDGLVTILKLASSEEHIASELGKFQVLVLKSCYPNSNIRSAEELETIKQTYRELAAAALRLRQRVILLTSPPLVIEKTTPANARRARALSNWLTTTHDLKPVEVVDVFGALAATSGPLADTLSMRYRSPIPFDSHPNRRGAAAAASLLADRLTSIGATPLRNDSSTS